jgi:KaiC/GvpD/RAD55 family RecA-like ATPase/predicted hydrocarbon binding protein
LDHVDSGISELDTLIGGGLRRGRMYLLENTTGTKARFFISAFLSKALADGELCKFDSFDLSYTELVEEMEDHGFDINDAIRRGRLLALDFVNGIAYGAETVGPLYKTKGAVQMQELLNLDETGWKEVGRLESPRGGLRVVIDSLSTVIREMGFDGCIKFLRSQTPEMKDLGGALIATVTPEMLPSDQLAVLEQVFDGVIELTVQEEKTKFQRYVRVKNSPDPFFRQERLPYEIVGTPAHVAIAIKITQDFESYKANLKMVQPGIIDSLGARAAITGMESFAIIHKKAFEVLGYEKGYEMLLECGREVGEAVFKPLFEKFKIPRSELTPQGVASLAELYIGYINLTGWGEFKYVRFDETKGRIYLRLWNSGIASQMLGYGKPVDAFVAGGFEGALKPWGKATCKEISCIAKGDEFCEFQVDLL